MEFSDKALTPDKISAEQKDRLSGYTKLSDSTICRVNSLNDTSIVGFATTQSKNGQLRSIQAIYYSANEETCKCLGTKEDMTNVEFVIGQDESSTFQSDNWFVNSINDGTLAALVVSVLGVVALVLLFVFFGMVYFA